MMSPTKLGGVTQALTSALRSRLKSSVETALTGSGLLKITRRALRGRLLILAYHNVVPDNEGPAGDRSLHLPRSDFAAHLDALCRTHDVVPLTDALQGGVGRGRPCVAITFDDAYRGAVTWGIEELARRGLPATVFVAPNLVGNGTFWWDELANPETNCVDPALRDAALTECQGRQPEVRRWAAVRGLSSHALPPDWHAATEPELRQAAATAGIQLASHTLGHVNLTLLDQEALRHELSDSLGWLRERFRAVLPWLAYPYGLVSNAVAEAAADAGYTAGVCISGGWLRPDRANPLLLPRLNVPTGLSLRGLLLRGGGLLCS